MLNKDALLQWHMKVILCVVTVKSKPVEVHRRLLTACRVFSFPIGFITLFWFQARYNSLTEPAGIHKSILQQLQ